LPSLILWDFDGTLGYRKDGMWSHSLLEAIQAAQPDSPVTLDEVRALIHDHFLWNRPENAHPHLNEAEAWWRHMLAVFADVFRQLGFKIAEAKELSVSARAIYLDPARWALFDDTRPALERCSAAGYTQAILSNHVPELLELIKYLGISSYFQAIFTSATIGYEKPHPKIFQYALQKLGGDFKTVWMIGDNIKADVLGAEALGFKGLLVRKPDERTQCYAETLDEIPKVLELF
jgi:putative hydrolase of the HAD superfamily